VLQVVDGAGLLNGKTIAVDATTLEANAAMKSIVRRDTGEDWNEYLKRLMQEEGLMTVAVRNQPLLRSISTARQRANYGFLFSVTDLR